MKTIAARFTPERRRAIQVFLGSLAPILILAGLATEAQLEQGLVISGALLQFAASLLSLINLRGAWSIWLVVRGAIYTLAMTVAPALSAPATSTTLLLAVSLGLSSLSSLLSIFVSGEQELAEFTPGVTLRRDLTNQHTV